MTSVNVLRSARDRGASKVPADTVGRKYCGGGISFYPRRQPPELSRISGFFSLPSYELIPKRLGVPHLPAMGLYFSCFFVGCLGNASCGRLCASFRGCRVV